MIEVPDGLIRPEVKLIGTDGNAFAVIGRTRQALKLAGNPTEVIEAFTAEATSGDYNHVLATCMEYAEVS